MRGFWGADFATTWRSSKKGLRRCLLFAFHFGSTSSSVVAGLGLLLVFLVFGSLIGLFFGLFLVNVSAVRIVDITTDYGQFGKITFTDWVKGVSCCR